MEKSWDNETLKIARRDVMVACYSDCVCVFIQWDERVSIRGCLACNGWRHLTNKRGVRLQVAVAVEKVITKRVVLDIGRS